jgi:hypothetical protein
VVANIASLVDLAMLHDRAIAEDVAQRLPDAERGGLYPPDEGTAITA